MQEMHKTQVWSLGQEDPWSKWQPTLSWKFPWTEKLGGLQSRGGSFHWPCLPADNLEGTPRSRKYGDSRHHGVVASIPPHPLIPGHPHLGKQGPRVSSDGRTYFHHRSLLTGDFLCWFHPAMVQGPLWIRFLPGWPTHKSTRFMFFHFFFFGHAIWPAGS